MPNAAPFKPSDLRALLRTFRIKRSIRTLPRDDPRTQIALLKAFLLESHGMVVCPFPDLGHRPIWQRLRRIMKRFDRSVWARFSGIRRQRTAIITIKDDLRVQSLLVRFRPRDPLSPMQALAPLLGPEFGIRRLRGEPLAFAILPAVQWKRLNRRLIRLLFEKEIAKS
jgi:hypothetical protein